MKRDNKHVVTLFLIALSGVLTYLFYRASVIRIVQAVRDLGLSVAYYFCSFFNVKISVTVTEFPDLEIFRYLPYDFDEILRRLREMWSCIFNGECLGAYFAKIGDTLYNISLLAMFLIPVFIILRMVIRNVLLSSNDKEHWEKSKPLIYFENKTLPRFVKVKDWLADLFALIKEKRYYFWPLLLIWLLNLNVLTILIEAVAYYFYFAMSADFLSLFVQLGKLIVDAFIMFLGAPLVFWLAAGYAFIVWWRKDIGYKRLNVCEVNNRKFIDQQPISIIITGTMGTGKTTMLTDVALSLENKMREDALDIIHDIGSRFPNFPWIAFEYALKKEIEEHRAYNLVTCRDWVTAAEERFYEAPTSGNIFGYDVEQYRYTFDDGLTNEVIWWYLKEYACAYFVFTQKSSLIISNYPIRVDNVLVSGKFPFWHSDFFRMSPPESEARSRFSHILDFDTMRLGRKMLRDNPRGASFEYGIVIETEKGKEHGNSLTNQELKKNTEETNQKNDLYSYTEKMGRHKATIFNKPFVRFVSDEQRAESLGADLRQLTNIVHIRERSPEKLYLPFFFITDLLHALVYPSWENFYSQFRNVRGDRTLLIYLLHNIMSAFDNYYKKMCNTFGVRILKLEVERGTMDGEMEETKYFICNKKTLSGRFTTDSHGGHFAPHLRKCGVGLNDYRTYRSIVSDEEELDYQNSYFIQDMKKLK